MQSMEVTDSMRLSDFNMDSFGLSFMPGYHERRGVYSSLLFFIKNVVYKNDATAKILNELCIT